MRNSKNTIFLSNRINSETFDEESSQVIDIPIAQNNSNNTSKIVNEGNVQQFRTIQIISKSQQQQQCYEVTQQIVQKQKYANICLKEAAPNSIDKIQRSFNVIQSNISDFADIPFVDNQIDSNLSLCQKIPVQTTRNSQSQNPNIQQQNLNIKQAQQTTQRKTRTSNSTQLFENQKTEQKLEQSPVFIPLAPKNQCYANYESDSSTPHVDSINSEHEYIQQPKLYNQNTFQRSISPSVPEEINQITCTYNYAPFTQQPLQDSFNYSDLYHSSLSVPTVYESSESTHDLTVQIKFNKQKQKQSNHIFYELPTDKQKINTLQVKPHYCKFPVTTQTAKRTQQELGVKTIVCSGKQKLKQGGTKTNEVVHKIQNKINQVFDEIHRGVQNVNVIEIEKPNIKPNQNANSVSKVGAQKTGVSNMKPGINRMGAKPVGIQKPNQPNQIELPNELKEQEVVQEAVVAKAPVRPGLKIPIKIPTPVKK
ncbi:Hypothetical_protein [Hexamita inflata]|uniref:Hypothetical_protein n=1 Tax=Hexamita inflata TaxID=28002 RepID=A0AA86ULZ8_9EUKA|nr:Hypothetical protein HINF_LOCUS48344 [Hexamita inflata]